MFSKTAAALSGSAPQTGSPAAWATDIDDYRWDHVRADCPVVEIHTTNRWGEDVTVRRRICV